MPQQLENKILYLRMRWIVLGVYKLEKYLSSGLALVIIGSLLSCSGSSTIEPPVPTNRPAISKAMYCYSDGDSLNINGSGFSVNAENTPNQNGLKAYICDSPNWSGRKVCENQNYSTWSDISINITVYLGSFAPGSTGYLYVSDNAGDVNQDCYPITFCGI
ncbi:MAG: hypothetical protein HGB32_15635 [Geobacteraceae bacterium]|nr:hypothetical protein [Geobacteraceae bacterium]